MQDGANDPAISSFRPATPTPDKEPVLLEAANVPVAVPVPPLKKTGRSGRWRIALLLAVGCGIGLAIGVGLTVVTLNAVSSYYNPIFTPLAQPRESMQIFNELNQMRQEINKLNEEKKQKEKEKDDAVQQALNSVTSKLVPPAGDIPGVVPPAMKPGGGAEGVAVRKRNDPFADVDEEIERLEQTQKALNKVLDLFTPKGKEPSKDR
jgi:hypothetical protein